MIIHPTKKSFPLFSNLTKSNDLSTSKAFSKANPFFSWHANYYNQNRKKVLVLVNDLTFMPVVLADINAKNKKQLANYIRDGIYLAFYQAGATPNQIQRYFELMGEIEVGGAHNRSAIGVTNMFISYLEMVRLDFSEVIQFREMMYLMEYGISALDEFHPRDSLTLNIGKSLVIHEVVAEELRMKELKNWTITNDWQDFSNWQSEIGKNGVTKRYRELFEEIKKNHRLILEDFRLYLTDYQSLSPKTVRRHVSNIDFFLNGFVTRYDVQTPISIIESRLSEFLSDFYVDKFIDASVTGMKQNATSLKKFYQYLMDVNRIDKATHAQAKEAISFGVEVGECNLEMLTSDFKYFW